MKITYKISYKSIKSLRSLLRSLMGAERLNFEGPCGALRRAAKGLNFKVLQGEVLQRARKLDRVERQSNLAWSYKGKSFEGEGECIWLRTDSVQKFLRPKSPEKQV